MDVITVKQLYEACKEEIKRHNGNKKILISSDEEGNSFNEMYYLFTEDIKEFEDVCYSIDKKKLKDYIILG